MNSMFATTRVAIKLGLLVLVVPVLTSCFLATTLQTFAGVFGERLISTAAYNYSPEYGSEVEQLLHALVADAKETLKSDGKVKREEYALVSSSPDDDQSSNYYVDQTGDSEDYYDERLVEGESGYIEPDMGQQYQQTGDYNELTSEQYPYALQDDMLTDGQQLPMSLDVDILVQRMMDTGRAPPSPIQDGDVLYSIQGDPKAGDKIKLSFRSSCDCYIYIVGIDATGYVTSVFPDLSSNLDNPVQANKNYLITGGTEWYGLDDYKGVEEIYFVASYNRRLDLERIINNLAERKRTPPADYQTVNEASGMPQTRGIVKVNLGEPASVQATDGSMHSFTPSTFINNSDNADLFITRWFYHH